MERVRPWQIVLFTAAVVGMAFAAWWVLAQGPRAKSTHRSLLVDVTTGELFEFSTKRRAVVIPERNPETGNYALFPVRQGEDGEWIIDARYLEGDALAQVEGEPKMVEPGSGRVQVTDERPTWVGSKRD